MIKTYKVQLKPNNKQKSKLFECAGVARWAYNWALSKEHENYKNGGKFIPDNQLRKKLTQLKKTEAYKWLYKYSNNITKQAIKDTCDAYKRFFKGQSEFPRFKSKKNIKQGFYHDTEKLKVYEKYVQLEKIGKIKLAEFNRIPVEGKYKNPRITYDGLHWWISVSIEEKPDVTPSQYAEPIGIDLGIKYLAVVSNGQKFKNINKSLKVNQIEKKLKRMQRQVSKKYEKGREGNRYKKTGNIKRLECQIRKLYNRLKNIRHDYIHQITSSLVKAKPMYIVIEDLNVKGMMKNKHLSKAIAQQCFYEMYRHLEYKCFWNGIRLILADRYYPSSKMCSSCGYINKQLSLSDREWTCPECGSWLNRDYNASINLREYGKSIA